MASDRVNNVFSQLGGEVREKLIEADQNEKFINEKLTNIQEKLLKVVKVQCKESYEWFENHSTQEKNGEGVSFKIDESNREEGQKYLKQLQECSQKYDYGLRDELMNSEREMNKITDEHQSCSNFCVETSQNKSDDELKSCFINCFNQTFNRTGVAQTQILHRLDDVLNNLNKF